MFAVRIAPRIKLVSRARVSRSPDAGLLTVPLTVLIAVAAISISSGSAGAACVMEKPDDILTCMSAAYADRDSVALRELFAEDYAFQAGDAAPWGIDEEAKTFDRMFADTNVTALELAFADGHSVLPGETAETWIIEADGMLTVTLGGGEPQVLTARQKNRLWVRRGEADQPAFILAHWIQESME